VQQCIAHTVHRCWLLSFLDCQYHMALNAYKTKFSNGGHRPVPGHHRGGRNRLRQDHSGGSSYITLVCAVQCCNMPLLSTRSSLWWQKPAQAKPHRWGSSYTTLVSLLRHLSVGCTLLQYAIAQYQVIIMVAETGSGKTTQVGPSYTTLM